MSTTYRACVIKGEDERIIRVETMLRGLSPVPGSVSHSDDYRELIFRVEEDSSTLVKLQEWINEYRPYQAPFPTGTLLAFSEAQDA